MYYIPFANMDANVDTLSYTFQFMKTYYFHVLLIRRWFVKLKRILVRYINKFGRWGGG